MVMGGEVPEPEAFWLKAKLSKPPAPAAMTGAGQPPPGWGTAPGHGDRGDLDAGAQLDIARRSMWGQS